MCQDGPHLPASLFPFASFYPKKGGGPEQQAGVSAGGGVCVAMLHRPLEKGTGGRGKGELARSMGEGAGVLSMYVGGGRGCW